MAPDFKTFLATEVISEQKTVSYRNVSRALKVHVNAAKCMLYDFYEKENKKKSGSIYATYVIAGRKSVRDLHEPDSHGQATNGDVPMPSSPPPIPSSMPEASQRTEVLEERYQVPIKSITLCREEQLEAVKRQYERITSIHIYSLSPARVEDLASLTETGRAVFVDYHAKQDPLIHNKDYGIIRNPHVWRRKGKRPANMDMSQPKLESKASIAKREEMKPTIKPALKKEESAPAARPSSRDSTTTQDSTTKSKPNLKRDDSSLFKAFAKQSAKPKLDRKDTSTSAASDSKMSGMDDNDEGESEDDAMFLDTGTSKGKKRPSDVQKEKDERQAKLRKMMDDEAEEPQVPRVADETGMDEDPPAAKENEDADAPDGDGENVDWDESDTEQKQKSKAKQEDGGPKRRRGKRKVMKKKTMKDEDGFLVTREEEVWESFSEDEPEPAATTKKPAFPAKSSTPAVAKSQTQKSTAPKSSGAGAAKKKDIMSFFGKK